MEKNGMLSNLMQESMDKARAMVDANTIVGQPISTPDGVTLIPISKISMGFGGAGATFGNKTNPSAENSLGAGIGTGVKIEPVAFLIVKDGYVRVMPVAVPASTTVDRLVEMVPDMVSKVGDFITKKKAEAEASDNSAVAEDETL